MDASTDAINTTTLCITTFERPLIASSIVLLSGTSFVSYCLFFATILTSNELRSSGFFKVMFSLAINDIFAQLTYLLVAAPSIYLGYDFSVVNIVVSSIGQEIVWFHNSLLLMFQSFNRLLSICYPEKFDAIFGGHRIWYFIGTAWIAGLLIGAATFWPCCHFVFFEEMYSFAYDSSDGARLMSYFDLAYTMTNLTIATAANVFTFRNIYKRHRTIGASNETQFQKNRRKRETKLFMQLFVTTVLLIFAELTEILVPMVTVSRFAGFVSTVVYIVAMSANSFVFLIVNKTVNDELKRLLRRIGRFLSRQQTTQSTEPINQIVLV